MRPIERRPSPRTSDFPDYTDAAAELKSRLGQYCSFCERRIPTNLAVEHIQPKGLPQYAGLIGRWDNFLLACVNCNSTKGDKDVVLTDMMLPDRDNTGAAYEYRADGVVQAAGLLKTTAQTKQAEATLALCGLDKGPSTVRDSNGQFVTIDRYRQRMEVWEIARESLNDLAANPTPQMRRQIVKTALASGFFSIWMTVFAADPVMRGEFIAAFEGTATSCYDATTQHVLPRPGNGLGGCSKC